LAEAPGALWKMRILELGKFYPPVRGGMESALEQICLGLRRRGHRVLALVSADERRASASYREGVAVWRLGRYGQIASSPVNPGLARALKRVRSQFRPQLVHLHLPNPAVAVAWLLFGDRQLPLVISYHSDIVRQRRLASLLEPLRQRVLARAAKIVVSSEDLRNSSRSLAAHRARCIVIPWGIDVDTILPGPPPSPELLPFPRYFLFVGRMVYYKGLEVLLAALQQENMPLVVVGEGPLRARWEKQAASRGLGDRVYFAGAVSQQALDTLYRGCVAQVLPSIAASETFGLVQLEAMARGRPVVAARASGGVASVQEDGVSGLLVPPADADSLRRALKTLWDDPQRAEAMGQAARARVVSHFHQGRRMEQLSGLLEGLVAHE
ncbi:MAG TPA: glycosyltransferase, partial [Candidatus Krumholzibacteria bacterium]|nr:glycosyltransferase [Candidatus Krumholzibacteria bacterium]